MSESTPDELELRAIAWCFGDDEEDPGLIAQEAARSPDFVTWLDRLARDYGALKSAHARTRTGLASARIAALREDIVKRQSGAVDWPAARGDNVRSLAAARTAKARAGSMKHLWIGAAVVAAAAAVLIVATSSRPPEVDANVARLLVEDVAEDGMGFAGAAPSARDRGFLLGAVLDLSRPRKSGAVADPELGLARDLADRALTGLDAPDDAEARRVRAMGGCGAILTTPTERDACERGIADYIARRDAYFATR